MEYIDQIFLAFHHLVEVLVSSWTFINSSLRDITNYTKHTHLELFESDVLLGLTPRHSSTSTVGCRPETVRLTDTFHDVRTSCHIARDYTEFTLVGRGSTLSMQPVHTVDLLSVVVVLVDEIIPKLDDLKAELLNGNLDSALAQIEIISKLIQNEKECYGELLEE